MTQRSRPTSREAPDLRTSSEPRHSPGLFRFRLHHAHRTELGVLLGPICLKARHDGGPFFVSGAPKVNVIREYYRRHVYLSNLIDETHYLLIRMEPQEYSKVRLSRITHLRKLLRYKRRAKGCPNQPKWSN